MSIYSFCQYVTQYLLLFESCKDIFNRLKFFIDSLLKSF